MTLTVTDIEAMDRPALVTAWSEMFQDPVPKGLSQSFLRRFLAFEVQARRLGGLPKGFLSDLNRHVEGKAARPDATLKPGGRLLREWSGVTHTVEVIDEGLSCEHRTEPVPPIPTRFVAGLDTTLVQKIFYVSQ